MLLDQNTIVLRPANGFYEEYVLDSELENPVLPGAILATKSVTTTVGSETVPVIQADGISTAVLTVPATAPAATVIDAIEPLIHVENALLGKSINHKAFPGEVTPVYRPVTGDRFLARAVAGTYAEGDPLYFIWTSKGYYFTKDSTATGAGTVVKAYAAESFTVTATTSTTSPKFFYDVEDDSTTERPSSTNMNGGLYNLLRVRFA